MKEELVCQKNLGNEGKLFTKKEKKNRINSGFNPLKVSFKNYKRREEMYMDCIILKEIEKNLDKKEKLFLHMFPKLCVKIYGIASKNTTNNILK